MDLLTKGLMDAKASFSGAVKVVGTYKTICRMVAILLMVGSVLVRKQPGIRLRALVRIQ